MPNEYTSLIEIPITKENLKNCAFSSWYSKFKGHTPKAEIINPLPKEFIQYLEQDGIKLPEDDNTTSFYQKGIERDEENEYSDWETDEEAADQGGDDDDDEIVPLRDFPELHTLLKQKIQKLGAITPKLNWSAPKDATWILPNNTTRCNEVNDLYLLLNASNYIMHDLQYAFDDCHDKKEDETITYELVLRQWFNINPALEFRVFVRNGIILGVSQRDLNYYDYLETSKGIFRKLIDNFVEDVVLQNFPDKSFVIDVYIPRPFEKVWLIDINPFARMTDSLMFSWNELCTMKECKPDASYEFRFVTENNTGRFASKEHSENQVPRELVEAGLDPKALRELTEKWNELLNLQRQEDSDDEEN